MVEVPEPPFVDEHAVEVSAPIERVWAALESYVDGRLATGRGSWFTRLLGASPASGFGVAARLPHERIELVGRHRFSRYRLVFTLAASSAQGTRLTATTYAAFPGPHGAAYRFVVIGLGPHVLVTRRMLASIAGRAVTTG
ncbi:MAG: hypothetical protein ABIO16_00795 [Nocardioides sp.]